METVALACEAMATRFEVVLHGEDPTHLRAAGEEALEEIVRLEARLSLYQPASEIARVNARAAEAPVRVSPAVFQLLTDAQRLSRETKGTFDITVAPLVRCWGFMGGTGRLPTPEAVAEAREKVGMEHLELRAEDLTVRFARGGMMIDLGAIGKGYALGCAAELLREAGITSALLHGGTSSVYAIGGPPDQADWRIAVAYPGADKAAKKEVLATIGIRDEALSVSAIWGRAFEAEGQLLGHVLDPRTGYPVTGAQLAAVVLPSAMETDALSTGMLVLGEAAQDRLSESRPGSRSLLLQTEGEASRFRVSSRGIPISARQNAV